MRELLSLEDGLQLVLEHVRTVGAEIVDILGLLGRVSGEDITAGVSIPPFDRSPLDGFAVRAVDIAAAKPEQPVELEVIGEIPAGTCGERVVAQKQAVKILTGAPIPDGADVIIRFEDVEQLENRIRVFAPSPPFTNCCFAGEDIKKGETVLTAGTLLGPGEIGILASQGIQRAKVFRTPRIAVLSTGDELVELDEALRPGKIYNSNLYGLTAHIRQMGCQPVCCGLAPDNSEIIATEIDKVLPGVDMLITTGGVSVGDYDLVRESLCQVGAEVLFWRLDMRPGTPVMCSTKDGKLIISLSGNPTAAMVVFYLLAAPVIRRLMGHDNWENISTTAELRDEFTKSRGQRRFLLGHSYTEQGKMKVKLTGKQSPGRVTSILGCNTLIDVPPNSGPLRVGDQVKIIMLTR